MRAPALPWWRPLYPAAEPRPTLADWWDALFGRLQAFYRVELRLPYLTAEAINAAMENT